jgi:hypothetical protein
LENTDIHNWEKSGSVRVPSDSPPLILTSHMAITDLLEHYDLVHPTKIDSIHHCVKHGLLQLNLLHSPSRLGVYVTETALNECQPQFPLAHRSDQKSTSFSHDHQLQSAFASFFPTTCKHHEKTVITDLEVYKLTDNQQLERQLAQNEPAPSSYRGMRTPLLPYQAHAVQWMLDREQQPRVDTEWTLFWVVLNNGACGSASSLSSAGLYYCPFWGWLARTRDLAKVMILGKDPTVAMGGTRKKSRGTGLHHGASQIVACTRLQQRQQR